MKYMLLICPDGSAPSDPATAEYASFTQEIIDSKELVAGEKLAGPDAATSVRVKGSKTSATDGPFVETKEFLGGFYVVDVPDLDRAIELAAKLPAASAGVVEIRPIAEM